MAENKNDAISIDDIAQLQEQLSSLDKDLQKIKGNEKDTDSREPVKKEEEESKEKEVFEFSDIYIFGRPNKKKKLDVFEQLKNIYEVNKGQLLVSFPEESDKELPEIFAGENVVVSSDKKQFFSNISGQLNWTKNVISVVPIKTFDGDIDSNLGDVYYKGTVHIKGNVLDGVKLRALGDIYVDLNVNKAELISQKNIFIKNGYKGRDGGLLKAKNNVVVKFVESGNIESDQNVIVGEAILHSNVSARNKIALIGNKRLIAGGKIIAGEEINCSILGTESFTPTEVAVGATTYEREQIENDKQKLTEYEDEIRDLDLNVARMQEQKEKGKLNAEHSKKLVSFKSRAVYLKDEIKRLKKRIKQTEEKLQNRQSGKICVGQSVYPGVKYAISRAAGQINKEYRKVTLIDEKGKLSQSSYEETELRFVSIFSVDVDEDELNELKAPKPVIADFSKLRRNIVLNSNTVKNGFNKGCDVLGLSKDDVVHVILEQPSPKNDNLFKLHIVEIKPGENKKNIKRKLLPKESLSAVQVEGDTIEECLQKASTFLKVSQDKLTYKILQKARHGIAGIGKKPNILKVSIREEKKKTPAESLSKVGKNIDGYFNILNDIDGLKLTVYSPKGDGAPVDEEAVLKDLTLHKYETDVDYELISDVVGKSEGKPVVVGPRQPEPELDGKFEIVIDDSSLFAKVVVYPAKENGVPVTYEDVIHTVQNKGIHNVKEEVIKEIFDKELYGEEKVIAEGKKPVKGEDAKIDYKIKVGGSDVKDFTEDEHGKVNFRELSIIENVVTGQTLAIKIPATEGQAGENIYGEEIPSVDGKDINLQPGKNTELSDDELELKAEIDGAAVIIGNKIKVDPIFHVKGDVSYETGNINFLGTVVITGAVQDDFIVRATGDIHVGTIGKAEVEAEGSIYVKSGIMGREQANIKAGMDLKAKFIERANVEVGRYLIIEEAIMHSKVSAGKSILVSEGKKGLLVGGVIRAGEDIYGKVLGSNLATRTVIEVGIDPTLRQRITFLENDLNDQKLKLDKVSKGIKALTKLKKDTGTLPENKESLLLELVGIARLLGQKLKSIEEEIKSLNLKIQESKRGKICIKGDIYSGVRVTIRNATLIISNELKFASFYYENGEVKVGNYEDPSKKIFNDLKGLTEDE